MIDINYVNDTNLEVDSKDDMLPRLSASQSVRNDSITITIAIAITKWQLRKEVRGKMIDINYVNDTNLEVDSKDDMLPRLSASQSVRNDIAKKLVTTIPTRKKY